MICMESLDLTFKVLFHSKELFLSNFILRQVTVIFKHADPNDAQQKLLIGSVVDMATYWCILLLVFSALLLALIAHL